MKETSTRDLPICYFYFNYKIPITDVEFASSILKQLVLHRDTISVAVSKHFDQFSRQGMVRRLPDILGVLKEEASLHPRLLIIIDALDECPEDVRAGVCAMAENLGPHVQLLITSRNLDIIGQMVDGASRLDIEAHAGDIESYIREKISVSGTRLNGLIKRKNDLAKEIVEKVAKKADGMCVFQPTSRWFSTHILKVSYGEIPPRLLIHED